MNSRPDRGDEPEEGDEGAKGDTYKQLAIIERYERFVDYLYPVLQNCPRRHGVARDCVLRAMFAQVEEFAGAQLGLTFSKWSVAPVSRGVNFLGYRIWPTHKLLRKQSVTRARRKLRALRNGGRDEARRRFAAAWLGHAQKTIGGT